jgi:Lsr2/Domain of unknown function (DUF3846)
VNALIIRPSGAIDTGDLPDTPEDVLKFLYHVIGCNTVTTITPARQVIMWLDDGGMVNGSPVNPLATTIFGTAVVIRRAPGGRTAGLPQDSSRKITALLRSSGAPTVGTQQEPQHERRRLMAQKIEVILVDDIDGSEATETVRLGLDGTSYEIDLNAANAAALRNALARFTGAGRKAGRTSRTAAANGRKAPDADLDKAEVRNWARANGVKVNERGRVPDAVVARYRAAHGG